MNVCHISTLTRWGGVERMLIDLLEHVAAHPRSIQHYLLTTSSHAEIRRFVPTKIVHGEPRRKTRYDPSALVQMALWLRARRIQVVHSYEAWANSWGNLAALLARVPVLIAGEHGTAEFVRPPLFYLDMLAYHRAQLVVANSQAMAYVLQDRFGVPNAKIRVIYNAVAPPPPIQTIPSRSQLGLPNGRIVGAVGRLVAMKDFQTLLRAAALIVPHATDVSIVIVGGGPQEAALRQLAIDLGLGSNVIFTGARADARSLMQHFDLLVSTSVSEPFGNVLIEAALAGKPVLAPAVGGIPEAVQAGITGELLQPDYPYTPLIHTTGDLLPTHTWCDHQRVPIRSLDPQRLAAAIIRLLDDPATRERYGKAGQAWASERFSIERYRNDLEALYQAASTAPQQT